MQQRLKSAHKKMILYLLENAVTDAVVNGNKTARNTRYVKG